MRAVAAENPSPIAHTAPRVTTRISRWPASVSHAAPPSRVNTTRKGRATARNARAADHAATSFPTTISCERSLVACRSARVASARSPLTEVADRVGAMISPMPRTKQTVRSYRMGAVSSASLPVIPASAVRPPHRRTRTTPHTTSMICQRVDLTR